MQKCRAYYCTQKTATTKAFKLGARQNHFGWYRMKNCAHMTVNAWCKAASLLFVENKHLRRLCGIGSQRKGYRVEKVKCRSHPETVYEKWTAEMGMMLYIIPRGNPEVPPIVLQCAAGIFLNHNKNT